MKVDIYTKKNIYDLLYIDPPWTQTKGGKKNVRINSSGKTLDYKTLSLDGIGKIFTSSGNYSKKNRLETTCKNDMEQSDRNPCCVYYKIRT